MDLLPAGDIAPRAADDPAAPPRVKYFIAAFHHLGRRIAFAPGVPDLWFEVARGEKLEERAQAAFAEHWRKAERDAVDESEVMPEAASLAGKAWVQVLELSATMPSRIRKPPNPNLLFLGDSSPPDGAQELRRVGRCLDWLYPDELDHAILRDREVEEFWRLLGHEDRRPVLLSGPRQSGKTAVVHECVHRRVAARKSVHVQRENVWLVSPHRSQGRRPASRANSSNGMLATARNPSHLARSSIAFAGVPACPNCSSATRSRWSAKQCWRTSAAASSISRRLAKRRPPWC